MPIDDDEWEYDEEVSVQPDRSAHARALRVAGSVHVLWGGALHGVLRNALHNAPGLYPSRYQLTPVMLLLSKL